MLNLNCSVGAIEYAPSRHQRDPCPGSLGARSPPFSNPLAIYDDKEIATMKLKLGLGFGSTHRKPISAFAREFPLTCVVRSGLAIFVA